MGSLKHHRAILDKNRVYVTSMFFGITLYTLVVLSFMTVLYNRINRVKLYAKRLDTLYKTIMESDVKLH